MDVKPTNWVGTRKDQQELFTEILAYLIAREVMDRNHMCMSSKNFVRIGCKLIDKEAYYTKATEHFNKLLTTWEIEYDNKTGIKNKKLNDDTLLPRAYRAVLRGTRPDGKTKKYEAVYEELE
jgi:hypothetical protein